jgi:Uma2 family endonuclease
MSSAAIKRRFTPEEYLALERKAPYKNEYHDGCIYAMSGASREHNLIAWNLNRELGAQLKDRPCEAYRSDMRVRVSATGLYTYPDVSVVCGEPQFLDSEVDTLLNPTLIIEVLSPTTEAYDRGKKFDHYRRLESLREYVLVAQDEVLVLRYTRRGDEWILSDFRGLDKVLELSSIECAVPLHEVYTKVQFSAVDPKPDGGERITR